MNSVNNYVQPQKICHLPVTIIDVFDDYALTNTVREEMYKCYPDAKLAHLKSGGNFPYLSRAADVNLHLQVNLSSCIYMWMCSHRQHKSQRTYLQVHLRQFESTEYAASKSTDS